MKTRLSVIFILLFFCSNAQNQYYVDSISNSLSTVSKKEQLNSILAIPYDKFIGNIRTSQKLVEKAISIAEELNDKRQLAASYLKMSLVYTYMDKREQKIEYNLKAIALYEEIGAFDKAGLAYGDLGFQIKYENFDDALFYMRKSIQLMENGEDKERIDAIYDNYGVLQKMSGKYDSATFYHNKSLTIKKALNDSIGIPYGYVHLATVNIVLEEFARAKTYIDSAHVIRTKRNDTYGITDDYVYYGDLYFAQKQYGKAIENFKLGFELSNTNNFFSLQKYCADYLTKSYLEINDYKNAFEYKTIHQALKDSTLNVQTNNKVSELQIAFETEKKEHEIASQKEQILKNNLQIRNRNLVNVLLGLSIFALGIILFGLYKRQQHKRREFQNRLALKEYQSFSELQNQRLRISRDLHDNIGSQLTFIISSIDNLKFVTNKNNNVLINKLNEITSFANDTIAQLRDTIWAMNKNEIAFDDFRGRVLSYVEKAKSTNTDIHYNFEVNIEKEIVFSSIVGINLFRVVQEAINNAIKHAGASEITITIIAPEEILKLKIEDNGCGFVKEDTSPGNGLVNMEQRIHEINGKLYVESTVNKGTKIKIHYPLNRSDAV